ncbi:MAG: branched-chain amino acid ABC transporter permease, partial [Methylobacteriaceae bacterium]|nr:branched-chain amino acid ABC transporter permease [Methylobacteriaceae bacterium]
MIARAHWPVIATLAALATIPLLVGSNATLNFLVFVLIIATAAQGWNLLGGVAGQAS